MDGLPRGPGSVQCDDGMAEAALIVTLLLYCLIRFVGMSFVC